jgi:hypothetical protein
MRLFGASSNRNLVVRVQGADRSEERSLAFEELKRSLAMYQAVGPNVDHKIKPPDAKTIARALSVLTQKSLQHRLFERILATFGSDLVDPLARILDLGSGGPLLTRMTELRAAMLGGIDDLHLSRETREVLLADLSRLLSDDYLTLLAEHEENAQRPRVKKLAQEVLHLVGTTFQRAFMHWPDHAERIAHSVHRRFSVTMALGEQPVALRSHIVGAIAEFLLIETSAELSGALSQLFSQREYAGLIESSEIQLSPSTYEDFAQACWEIVADYG